MYFSLLGQTKAAARPQLRHPRHSRSLPEIHHDTVSRPVLRQASCCRLPEKRRAISGGILMATSVPCFSSTKQLLRSMRRLLLTCLAAAAAARKAAPVVAAKAAEEPPARLVVEGRLVTGSALHEVRVVLNDGEYTAIPRQDGSFVFLTVAPGSYLLEVHDVHNVWPMVRVDVSAKSAGKIRAILTHTKEVMALPITLEPVLVKPKWFEVRPPFQVRELMRAHAA